MKPSLGYVANNNPGIEGSNPTKRNFFFQNLTEDGQLITDQFLRKPFFDLKSSLGSVVNYNPRIEGSNPIEGNFLFKI